MIYMRTSRKRMDLWEGVERKAQKANAKRRKGKRSACKLGRSKLLYFLDSKERTEFQKDHESHEHFDFDHCL